MSLLSRLAAICAVALLMSACGSSGSDEAEPGDRVAAAAWREWRKYGGDVVLYVGGAGGRASGTHETREPLASRVGDYWKAAGRPEWNGRTPQPWSGAFVSWTMREAGFGARDFKAAGRHADYMMAMLDQQLAGGGKFAVVDWRDAAPKPGDLVCAAARAGGHRDARALRAAVGREATHCDVVIDNRGGRVRAIGGNVRDTVSMSVYPADSSGHLANVPGRPWLAVVRRK